MIAITCLFVDVGGVLLTNGWDHHARRRAAKHFKLDWTEMQNRHSLMFETHEEGKLTFDEYLARLIFYQKRPFTRAQFRRFMFAQSKPYRDMIELVTQLKVRYGLRIVVVSNESREVNAHRIRQFKLDSFVDCFISSCFVHIRKPDADIFRLALDIARRRPARCCTSKTLRCSSKSRKVWEFEAFFTPITSPLARSWLRSDLRTGDMHETAEFTQPDEHSHHQWRFVEYQVRAVSGR